MIKNIYTDFKCWLSYFFRSEYLLTPLVIDKWENCPDDKLFEIFIFGFRIFAKKNWG